MASCKPLPDASGHVLFPNLSATAVDAWLLAGVCFCTCDGTQAACQNL